MKLFLYQLRHDKKQLQSAVSRGQYSYPKGLFYGGNSASWSHKLLKEILINNALGAREVVVVDIHTGLGSFGSHEIIMNVEESSVAFKRAKSCWGQLVKTTVTGSSVSPDLRTTLKLSIPKTLPQSEVTAVSLEFGTSPPTDVFWALWAENWLFHYGGNAHPRAAEIKRELLRVFYPDDAGWRAEIWSKGKMVIDDAVVCMNE